MAKGYVYRADRPNTPYRVVMTINRRATYIGSYMTAEEASEAYKKARAEHPELPKNGGRKKGSKYPPKPKTPPIVRMITSPRWTDEQKEKLWELYNTTDLSYRNLGEQIGKSRKAVDHKLRELKKSR